MRRFVEKTGRPAQEVTQEMTVNQPFLLVTPTTGFGEVPSTVARFLRLNSALLHGIAASGNRNFGNMYANAADTISEQYNVPVISRFELAGTDEDVRKFNEGVDALSRSHMLN